jgi:hypothetical protein
VCYIGSIDTVDPGEKAVATKTVSPSKSAFVRDFLRKNRSANRKAVEQAWREAGHQGPIQSSLVSTLRRKLGLMGSEPVSSRPADGNRAAEPPTAKARATKPNRRGRRRKGKASDANGTTAPGRKPSSGGRDRTLVEIEQDLDRLIFKLMTLGGFEEIEHEFRKLRRLLYRSSPA